MKKWLSKIDPLIVFFLLSLVTLYSFVGDYNYFLPKTKQAVFKSFTDSKYVFKYPKQGMLSGNEVINVLNPYYIIKYSVDGGKTYQLYQNQSVLNLKPKNYKNITTSIRFKKPFGKMPEICSFLVKAEHINGKQFTKPIQLTYYSNYDSNLPIVNLILNEDDLFHYKKGIMNLGEMSWYDKGFYKKPWDRNANYKIRGALSKKESRFQYFEKNQLVYEKECTFSIGGNATRSFSQKSFKLKTDRDNNFKYHFFKSEGLRNYKSIVLRQSGNDNKKTLFADLLMQNLATNLNVLTQKGLPCHVFINGNYWGVYNFRERYDTYFIGESENVNPKKVTILEGGNAELKKGKIKVRNEFLELIDTISNIAIANNEFVDYLSTIIDVESLTNYILIETFFGNGDWLNNNIIWYKAGKNKWKWLLNDLDYALAYSSIENVNVNYLHIVKQSNSATAKLFNFLLTNKNYKRQFKQKAIELTETNFSENNIKSEYLKLIQPLKSNIEFQINRWRDGFSRLEWEQNCDNNLKFLLNRRPIFLNQIEKL